MMPRKVEPIADATATTSSRIVLLGRDHEDAGAVVTARATDAAALGLARGWRPKPYAYVDPNEDAVACAVGPRARLLVVADGHNGRRASHAALAAVMDLLGGDPRPADLTDDEMVAAAQFVDERIAKAGDQRRPRSRTTLIVALRTATHLQWFGAGDSSLLVVGAGRARQLRAGARWFFGDQLASNDLRRSLARGRIQLATTGWVVLATDGYTDYLPDALTPTAAAVAAIDGAGHVERAAAALLDQARLGGAGDNVGVSICGPW